MAYVRWWLFPSELSPTGWEVDRLVFHFQRHCIASLRVGSGLQMTILVHAAFLPNAMDSRECNFQIFFFSQFVLVLLYYTMPAINPIAATEEVQENLKDGL